MAPERAAAAATLEDHLRLAVAVLMARAEVAFAKENGDWRERKNVAAHFRQLVAHDYTPGDGETTHLTPSFGGGGG